MIQHQVSNMQKDQTVESERIVDRKTALENQSVALLTGGGDRPYVVGLAKVLASNGVSLELIGSDDLDGPDLRNLPGVNFLNLRGDQRPEASLISKVLRVLTYYVRLIGYAATAKPKIFHILWNNKFEIFDRTLLMLYYKALGKKIVFTAHNVNVGKRDSVDTRLNRLTLKIQYRLADHIFVHTDSMKRELIEDFGIELSRVTVIPFGINNAVPNTRLAPDEARRRLGIRDGERTILFYGRIAPRKGLDYLTAAFHKVRAKPNNYRLIIAGRPERCERYWAEILEDIREDVETGRVLLRAAFIPDDETELYFKAADVLVLPYRHIYQSGVIFLAYSFGLPVLAADVGSVKDDVVEGKTGFVFRPEDPVDLANTIEKYFKSDCYAHLKTTRQEIRDYAMKRHSWDVVSEVTLGIYTNLLRMPFEPQPSSCHAPSGSFDVKAGS